MIASISWAKERRQVGVTYVPGGHDEQAARGRPQEVAVAEVSILRDDDAVGGVGRLGDVGVHCAVAVRQLGRVNHIVPGGGELAGQSNGKLSVDEELHAAPSGTTRRIPEASAPNSSAANRSSRSRSG